MTTLPCPLCAESSAKQVFTIKERRFYECSVCDLLFVQTDSELSPEQERARYELHHNDPSSQGYREHLCRLKEALIPKLTIGEIGLDFGCGPTQVLSDLFKQDGYEVHSYDPFFYPSPKPQPEQYDFLLSTEVIEHFADPCAELASMISLIKRGGWLALMTNLREDTRRVESWWYLRDLTHRTFYSSRTFEKLTQIFPLTLEQIKDDVILLRKG